jgi:bile acid:Na+ symporter, BASS family
MDFQQVLQLMLKASVAMIVLSLGLQATIRQATYLFRRPGQLLRSLFGMLIVMPLAAVVLVQTLPLPPAIQITLIVLSVSPVPPILPRRELAAGGNRSYALGLLVAAAAVSIVFVPAAVNLFGRIFDKTVAISTGTIARIVTASVIAPMFAGLALRRVVGESAAKVAGVMSRAATLLLALALLPVLFTQMGAFISLIGHATLLALVAFVLVGLVAGFLLSGPVPGHRIVLALSTATRHPGVATAIATANFPDQKLVLPALLLYLIVSVTVSEIFLSRLRRNQTETGIEKRQSPAA